MPSTFACFVYADVRSLRAFPFIAASADWEWPWIRVASRAPSSAPEASESVTWNELEREAISMSALRWRSPTTCPGAASASPRSGRAIRMQARRPGSEALVITVPDGAPVSPSGSRSISGASSVAATPALPAFDESIAEFTSFPSANTATPISSGKSLKYSVRVSCRAAGVAVRSRSTRAARSKRDS